jgi:hypothetical protein
MASISDAASWTTTYVGAGDPADLFYNVGISRDTGDSPWARTYPVLHFYYNVAGEALVKAGGSVPIPGVARWAVEFPGSKRNAERIWRNRGPISDVVAAHGGKARLRVEFTDDRMRLTEYDWDRWAVDAPALP